MVRFNYILLTFLISVSTFFFTESQIPYAVKEPTPLHEVIKSTAVNNQGIIVDSSLDFTVNTSQEDNITFFKQLHLKNTIYKEQQENYLVYQKASKLITVGLSTKQIIFPFHSFT